MHDSFQRTYELARDREYIERIQMVTVRGEPLGLAQEHGLFGSKRWFAALEERALATTRLEGVIRGVGVDPRGWPQFELEVDGERTTWGLEGDPKAYRPGARARIDFVDVAYANPSPGSDAEARVVLGIWIECPEPASG